jgi:hypothetical protein
MAAEVLLNTIDDFDGMRRELGSVRWILVNEAQAKSGVHRIVTKAMYMRML